MQPILLHDSASQREKFARPNCPYFLTLERIRCISNLLNNFMDEEKPYLKTGYYIRDLANETGVPAYQLSAYINQVLLMNFNDYFNWFRIRHCQELMESPLVDRLNLRGLAYKCGFNNRNTLTTAFKKFTGVTPSDYGKKAI
jgi:AraC-like DNA-binding protein